MEKTYIYTLSDTNGDVRYIGKTSYLKQRLYSHIKECRTKKINHKINWIKSLLMKGEKPLISILDEVDSNYWQFWECFWIEQFKQWGFNLTNQTKGGDGLHGYKHSNVSINKMKQKFIDNPNYNKSSDKKHIIDKDELYQRYITENLSIPKLSKLFGCSEKTIFTNLHENNIIKDKEVWIKQMSTNPKKPVVQYDLDGNFVREWDSPTTIAEELGYNKGNIASCCRGVAVTANGYIWRYKGENYVERLNHKKRSVSQYDRQGNHVMTFESISTATLLGFNDGNIQNCCVGRSKSHRGFIWRYAEDSPPEKYKNKQQRVVNQYSMNGDFIRSWDSIASVTKELGIGGNSITTCCKGGYKSAGGFVWKYNQ